MEAPSQYEGDTDSTTGRRRRIHGCTCMHAVYARMHTGECDARSAEGVSCLAKGANVSPVAAPLERKAGALDAAPMEPIHSRPFTCIGSLSRLANLCLASDLHGRGQLRHLCPRRGRKLTPRASAQGSFFPPQHAARPRPRLPRRCCSCLIRDTVCGRASPHGARLRLRP